MVKVLEVNNLSYKDFSNITISFNSKTFYSVIGSNKSGKTTLFKLLAGFIPSNNNIICNNVSLNKHSFRQYIINLGIVEKVNKNSFIYKSVIDELINPLRNLGVNQDNCLKVIKEILRDFNSLRLLDKNINELNFYDKQLLLIIIALLHKPHVLLIDSILEIFPKKHQEKIARVLKKYVSKGLTIINFSSNLEVSCDSDLIILLDRYKIIGEYKVDDIYNNDKLFYEHNLEIPFMIDLSIKLKMYNLVNKEYHDMKEMVDDIWP